MTEFPELHEVLAKAGARLKHGGLAREALWNDPLDRPLAEVKDDCEVCMLGALNWAICGTPGYTVGFPVHYQDEVLDLRSEAEMYLIDAIRQENPVWFGSSYTLGVPEFNDDPATDTEQAVHIFNVAARNAEAARGRH